MQHPHTPPFDFHTHRLDTPPGTGIVSLPRRIVLHPEAWHPQVGGLYAAGTILGGRPMLIFGSTATSPPSPTSLALPEVVASGRMRP